MTTEAKNEPDAESHGFDWIRFAQCEIKHLQVLELLEASLAEAEQVVRETKSRSVGLSLLAFSSAAKKAAEQRETASAALAAINRRIHEERRALLANERALHQALHDWLLAHDPQYAVSAEMDLAYEKIDAGVEPLSQHLVKLLSGYGATFSEIAVAYNHSEGELSPAGIASIERLIASYDELLEAENRFTARLDQLNKLVDGTMFRDLQLRRFNQALPPQFRIGMDYQTLRNSLEEGTRQVRAALEQIHHYAGEIGKHRADKEKALFNYRESRWQRHLAMMKDSI